MRRTAILAAVGAAAALAAPSATAPAAAALGVQPFVARAPESAFTDRSAADGGVACQRPAPDNRVSTTIHCYRPDDLRSFYGLGPLASSNDGAGQTIVLVDSYGSPTAASDLSFFAQTFGGPAPDFEAVFPLGKPDYKNATGNGTGQSGPTAADNWAGEANLDVQWAYAMAPKAHIVLLATPPAETQGVQGLPNLMKAIDWAIGSYPEGTVFSMSFGTDEQAFAGAAATQFAKFDQTFKRGLARHDTFFSSAGDTGSVGVVRSHRAGTTGSTPEVSYPNVSPYVTSVGGTQVQSGWTWNPTQDKPFLDTGARNPAYWSWTPGGSTEPVWNESWAGIATGGGLSTVYGRPGYQDGVASVVGSHRGVPDLAWDAAVNGGVLVFHSYFPELEGNPAWGVFGGTSASSPQVAAVTAIANQARAAAGKAPIGDLNAVIYGPGFDRLSAFRDVAPHTYGTTPSGVLKDNRIWDTGADGFVTPDPVPGYPTTTGYDLTTGWGSPWAPGYVSQLAAH
ncbi:MAG: S53 family peptidase [Mycobacteriales bacterium]